MREIFWHKEKIERIDRERLNGHKGVTLWFTGLSGSGKSTVANALEEKLYELGCRTMLLDGDNIRFGLNRDLGFSPEDRKENIRRIAEVAKLFTTAGIINITAFISPYIIDRLMARETQQKGDFIEIYVKCPLGVCEKRDVKGLYKRARSGEIKDFTGIDAPYEEPENPEIVIETDKEDIEISVKKIISYLKENGYVGVEYERDK